MSPGRPVALIVDDNVGFLRVVRRLLGDDPEGFEVHTVGTGSDALAFVQGQAPFTRVPRPSFVVLDFHLPDMDAPEIVSRIRDGNDTTSLPLLVISQANWPEDEAAAVQAGCDRFCVKPSDLEELHGTIVEFWRDVRARGLSSRGATT